ncbi:MAG TPA: transglutaminase family protein [Paracoccaceae bacterium]|nr:transglutaminase family protein [Paracoccaceae bacterium]
MRLQISHITRYTFDHPATYGLQQIRKTPKSSEQQQIISWETTVTGGNKELSYEDHHRNTVELISFEKDATALTVRCEGIVEVADTGGMVGKHIGLAPLWLFRHTTPLTKAGAGARALLRSVTGETDLEKLHSLSREVLGSVAYELGAPHTEWNAEQVLSEGRGVCQDHAHVFIACAREMGIPARYVSGYLMLDDKIEQDAAHAWVEAHVEGLGWVGFDVSNEISPDARYVRVATGLDYLQAAPVTGTRIGGAGETLSVQIEVTQL